MNALGAVVVVVDNGTNSAEQVVKSCSLMMKIHYERLLEPGLSMARNRSMAIAMGLGADFLAFVDDDERPAPKWLNNLLATMRTANADIVQGPVLPIYDVEPPRWVGDGDLFSYSGNGHATGNLMLRCSSLPKDEKSWFDPDFNFIGGEDNEFLSRLARAGLKEALAHDAIIYEHVPATRMTARFIYARGLRDGLQEGKFIEKFNPSFGKRLVLLVWKCLAKLGYGLNHLFWSVTAPWRFHRAIADFASILGILIYCSGGEVRFYGRKL